jgi:hypothetical protein
VTVDTGKGRETWVDDGGFNPWANPCPVGMLDKTMRSLRYQKAMYGRPERARITLQRLDCITCDGEGTRRPYEQIFKPGPKAGPRCRACKGCGEVEGPAVTAEFIVTPDVTGRT